MSLSIKKVTSEFKDLEKLKRMNDEAFPEEEHMKIEEILQMIENNQMEVTAIYDSTLFVGFYAMVIFETIAYIFFLAIDNNVRSKGYGSKALTLMKEQYPNYQIVLDLESIDVNADNLEQRKSRKQFYLRNGFQETDYNLNFNGMQMEVLASSHKFDSSTFRGLLSKLKNERASMELVFKN